MRVLLVTTWGTACGIAEHAAYLKESVEAADSSIEIIPHPLLHPSSVADAGQLDLIWLNYQAGLLSQWRPEDIRIMQQRGIKVGCTFHDTGVPNSDQCKAVIDAADAAVVHEPFDDLPAEKVRYWRMGVPAWELPTVFDWDPQRGWSGGRPVLGSIGFPFGWKNYDQLARVSVENGWALLLIAPTATDEQIAQWRALNPHLDVYRDFVPRREALQILGACDATAFCYVCHNTGQSAALLQGIAARKPVIAFSSCRQNRALYLNPLGREAICWTTDFDGLAYHLRNVPIQRVDPQVVALAEQESWMKVGQRYAELYRSLVV